MNMDYKKNIMYLINNFLFKYLHFYVIFIGISLIVYTLFFYKGNRKKRIKENTKIETIIKVLVFPITFMARILMPKSDEKKHKYQKYFNNLGLNMSLDRFFILKVITPLIVLAFLLTIHYTNVQYKTKEMLYTSRDVKRDISEDDLSKAKLQEVDYYILYNYVKKEYPNFGQAEQTSKYEIIEKTNEENNLIQSTYANDDLIKDELILEKQNKANENYDKRESYIQEITEVIQRKYQLDEKISPKVAAILYEKIGKAAIIKQVNIKIYYFSILSLWIPDVLLIIFSSIKRKRYKEDIEILKITTSILGGLEGMTLKRLLLCIREVSNVYRNVINNALNNYNSIQDGKIEATMDMAKDVDIPQFRKLCSILKEIGSGNKSSAIANLEEDMVLEDKENEMRSNDRIEKKTWLAIIIISPTILLLALLLLKPFASYYQNINFN